jgi:putative peptidoglycan lipid II flippase
LWAVLVAGLPMALPFAARSMASVGGEGGLATFNYAWKLVELPLLLAIQLVATLAFPAVAAALAGRTAQDDAQAVRAVRGAFALSWTLACAAAAALVVGAPALARLLFGWGRMDPAALAAIGQWAAAGAWGLLPQALTAVALTVLAAQGRLRPVAVAYAAALAVLLACGARGVGDGLVLMHLLNLLFLGIAAVALAAVGPRVGRMLPARALALPLACLGVLAALRWLGPAPALAGTAWGLAAAVGAASLVAGASWLGSADLRDALRR